MKKISCINTMEYHSDIKNKQTKKGYILLFTITWMNLGGIMLSEISQKKTNIILYHFHVEYILENKFIETKSRIVVVRRGGVGKMGKY